MKKVIPGKPIGVLLMLALSLFVWAPRADAYMYGEEQPTSQLVVDKRIKTTTISNWQDNLPASQVTLKEGDLVDFKIIIKNTGDKELKNIRVTDYLPSYLEFIFGSAKPNDQREINWTIDKLSPGKEKEFRIRTKISGSNQANTEGTFCLMNKSRAEAETGEADEDTASFCLLAAKKLPQAGSHNLALGTLIIGLIGSIGIILRKFGRGEIFA